MAAPKKKGLGRGLEALFEEISVEIPEENQPAKPQQEIAPEAAADGVLYVDINDIRPNAHQPRKTFDEDKLDELAASIKEHGIIQPVVLRSADSGYEIVAGERRWRAARKAGIKKIPCVIKELTDEQNMLVAIIENMQREDLNPIEEAEGLSRMIEVYGLTQEQVSKGVGKSRPYITNSLRLLKLSDDVLQMTREGKLTAGHARALAGIKDQDKQKKLALKTIKEGLSVRSIEKLAGEPENKKPRIKPEKNPDIIRLESELKDTLGTRVTLNSTGKKGKIEIEYYSRDELERLIELLKSLG